MTKSLLLDTNNQNILAAAKQVLTYNTTSEGIIIPAQGLYPHQVLWDSCFIAIGLSNYNLKLAQKQILTLLKAQWLNGMIPNIVFSPGLRYWLDRHIWRSRIAPQSNPNFATGGITQPPMLAEAVVRIGNKLTTSKRKQWYRSVYPALLAYHEWLYIERDPKNRGLVTLIHPWETGLDNTPPLIATLRHQHEPRWINLVTRLKLDKLADHIRFDAKYVDYRQRNSTIEALSLYAALRRLRKQKYNTQRILEKPPFAIEDLTYNCILIRANELLSEIAKTINETLPPLIKNRIIRAESSLDQLWDNDQSEYFSRNFTWDSFIREPSIAALLPLYSGAVSPLRALELVKSITSFENKGVNFPVPSVPPDSSWFKPMGYWQGPTWINMNWLIIDGLKRYGFNRQAELLTRKTLDLVGNNGFYEYFNPLNGNPAGIANFSWSAALAIDLIMNTKATEL
jgi:hypothetical protein